jgi:hypothetical protein
MNPKLLLCSAIAFGCGAFVAATIPALHGADDDSQEASQRPTATNASDDPATSIATPRDMETQFREAFKDFWSFSIEGDELLLKWRMIKDMNIDGCENADFGFEVYSVAAETAGPGRFYNDGGIRLGENRGTASVSRTKLAHLRALLAVPNDVQRALVVRFWAGPQGSKIRYLVGERLWDGSW